MKIERIEIYVTSLAARVQRIFSSGSYDTGPAERVLGKPVLVRICDFVLRDGHVEVPRGPGLGVTIDEAALKKRTLLQERVG